MRRRIVQVVVLVFCGFFFTVSQAEEADPRSYYPLDEGLVLEYEVMAKSIAGEGVVSMAVENLPAEELAVNDKKITAVPQKYDDGTLEYIVSDGTGVSRVASKNPEWRLAKLVPPMYYLKFPLQVGATWEVESFMPFGISKELIKFKVRVEEVSELVELPQLGMQECVRIKIEGSYFLPDSKAEIRAVEYSWYARGLGLVQKALQNFVVAENGSRTSFFQLVVRLRSYQRPQSSQNSKP